jgi:hypothetical protein
LLSVLELLPGVCELTIHERDWDFEKSPGVTNDTLTARFFNALTLEPKTFDNAKEFNIDNIHDECLPISTVLPRLTHLTLQFEPTLDPSVVVSLLNMIQSRCLPSVDTSDTATLSLLSINVMRHKSRTLTNQEMYGEVEEERFIAGVNDTDPEHEMVMEDLRLKLLKIKGLRFTLSSMLKSLFSISYYLSVRRHIWGF